MGTRKPSRRSLLLQHLAGQGLTPVNEQTAERLCLQFGTSSDYLRRVLMEGGIAMSPLVEGVRQDTPEHLERTLLALLDEYERGDTERRRQCRLRVIAAKDHARLALRREPAERRLMREEAILWMLTWLENPGVFAQWLALRKQVMPPGE